MKTEFYDFNHCFTIRIPIQETGDSVLFIAREISDRIRLMHKIAKREYDNTRNERLCYTVQEKKNRILNATINEMKQTLPSGIVAISTNLMKIILESYIASNMSDQYNSIYTGFIFNVRGDYRNRWQEYIPIPLSRYMKDQGFEKFEIRIPEIIRGCDIPSIKIGFDNYITPTSMLVSFRIAQPVIRLKRSSRESPRYAGMVMTASGRYTIGYHLATVSISGKEGSTGLIGRNTTGVLETDNTDDFFQEWYRFMDSEDISALKDVNNRVMLESWILSDYIVFKMSALGVNRLIINEENTMFLFDKPDPLEIKKIIMLREQLFAKCVKNGIEMILLKSGSYLSSDALQNGSIKPERKNTEAYIDICNTPYKFDRNIFVSSNSGKDVIYIPTVINYAINLLRKHVGRDIFRYYTLRTSFRVKSSEDGIEIRDKNVFDESLLINKRIMMLHNSEIVVKSTETLKKVISRKNLSLIAGRTIYEILENMKLNRKEK